MFQAVKQVPLNQCWICKSQGTDTVLLRQVGGSEKVKEHIEDHSAWSTLDDV